MTCRTCIHCDRLTEDGRHLAIKFACRYKWGVLKHGRMIKGCEKYEAPNIACKGCLHLFASEKGSHYCSQLGMFPLTVVDGSGCDFYKVHQ